MKSIAQQGNPADVLQPPLISVFGHENVESHYGQQESPKPVLPSEETRG